MRKHFYKICISIIFLFNVNIYGQVNIFIEIDEKSMATEVTSYLDILKAEESYKQLKVVKLISTDFYQEDKISISLFDGLKYDFSLTKKIEIDSIAMKIIGNMDNNSGFISLILRNNNLTGTIQVDNKQFSIVPLGSKIHSIIEIDYSKLKPEEPPIEIDGNNTLRKSNAPNSIQSAGSTIDILVAYTPAANTAVADIKGLIENAIGAHK